MDQVPEWECPACAKAYAKTSRDSPPPTRALEVHGPSSLWPRTTRSGWDRAALLLGIACVPFALALFWLVINSARATAHPVPPDRVIQAREKGGRIVYMTAAEVKRQKELMPVLLFLGLPLAMAFAVVNGIASRSRGDD